MALSQSNEIDLIGISNRSDECILTIVDDEPWEDIPDHLERLQKKLNAYLAFVESGELLSKYPSAKGRKVAFGILHAYPLPEEGRGFLERAAQVIEGSGFRLEWEPLPA